MNHFKNLSLPDQLIAEIEKYRTENFISTFTAAAIQLLKCGLEYERKRKK